MSDNIAESFDIGIIGAGPAGYVAAIRAAQLNLKVAIFEKRDTFGGTCLNVGCIPSKALLNVSHHYVMARDHFANYGINVDPKLDLQQMMRNKQKTVTDLTKGVEFLLKKNKVTNFQGTATIGKDRFVKVQLADGSTKDIMCQNIIVATGSEPAPLGDIAFDEKDVLSSTGALELDSVPKHLVVVGAGVIGLELGSVWARLGAEVSVVEFLPRIVPTLDGEVAKNLQRILSRQGLKFMLSSKLESIQRNKQGMTAVVAQTATGKNEGKITEIECDKVLIATGRRPTTHSLGLEQLGVVIDQHGFIQTDENFRTNVEYIYAIGDCRPGPMLAHKGEEEGVSAIEHIAGLSGHVNYDTIPGVIYTDPEVANVGMHEEQLKEKNIAYKIGKFPFVANSRARTNDTTQGFIKLLSDANDDRILGAHIIGPNAGELIHEFVAVMEFGGSSEDIARMCHAHPTLSEALKESALAVDERTIHA